MLTSDLPIAERASPVLYHYTTPRAALEILRSGEFQLSSVVGNPSEQQLAPKGHPYFLSTTRSRVGDYHRYTHNSAVMFTLDGDWFNRNYKVRPVDYWERAWDYPQSNRSRESEDRVFSREATIPAAGIRAVHVLVKGQDDRSGSHVRKVLITAKQQGIPAHLYQDERAWRVQDTSKAIPMDQARDLLRGREASPWGGRGRRYLEPWVELIHKNKTADLSADAAKLVHNIVYYHRGDPTEDMNLGVDLANARKPGEADRPLAVKLIGYLKKFDFDTRRMVKDLHDKWAEIKTQEYEAKRAETKEDISESTLVEVSMSPGDLRRWAQSPEAEGIQAGFEAELIFRDAERDGGDDSEPDWDADRRAESIDDVMDFFSYDEYGYGLSGRGYNRVREGLYEEYLDWREEAIMDEWSNVAQEQVEDYMESNVWGDDSLRDEYRDQAQIELGWKEVEVEDLTDEQKAEIEDLSRKMFEEDVQEQIGTEGNYYDDAREYFRDMMADSDDYDEEAFLSDKYRYMSDIRDAWDLDWPYYSGGGSGEGRTVEDIANSLSDALDGASVVGSSGYHSTTRKPGRWIIEPDGSLDPDDSDEAGLEVVSPPMPLPQALEALQKVVDWANGDGDAYTNSSTGLHMGVSVPYKGGDVDYVKLILFLGDQYVLEQFGRMSNSYCRSALAKLRDVQRWRQERLDGDSKSGVEKTAAAMDLMRKNLVELAAKYVQDGVGKDKYTSAHIKDGYIEFRSPGGDYLSQVNREDFVVLESTMLRFARAMHIASRPDLERKEYIKKLYKLIDPTGDESLKLFLDYSTGKINQEDLKKAWARGVLAKEQPRQAGGEKYEIFNQDTGEVLDVVSGENQEQLTLAVTDAIEKYSGQGFNFSIRKQEQPGQEPSRRAKVAQKIASRPMVWRVTDTNTGKTLLVAADTASLAKVAAEQQDRHWFELRRNDPDSFVAQSATGSEIRQYMASRPAGDATAGGQSTQQQSTGAEQRYRVRWTERRNGEEVQDSLVVAARNADAAMDSIRSALDAQGRQPVSIEADLAGSTQDLQRQRAQQATGGEQFTGRWEIRNASNGDILHTFGGIGNNQSDANRFAAGWLGRNRPDLVNQEIEVVPEMR